MSNAKKRRLLQDFSPNRPLTLITASGISVLQPADVSAEIVGWKAFGLNSVPTEWVPPFFVVSGELLRAGTLPSIAEQWLQSCVATSGLAGSRVAVRSSGSSETLEHRGGLVSDTCPLSNIRPTIEHLSSSLPAQDGDVHWIVQTYLEPERKGHLSNERRVSREPRDWLIEFEPRADLPGYTTPIGIRRWREGTRVDSLILSCGSATGVTVELRKVALWASRLRPRIHFEWVWTGTEVWIVQADAERARAGVDPHKLRPAQIPDIRVPSLSVFRPATKGDFDQYRKLRNAKLYQELGYTMPSFFVLDESSEIQKILDGFISDDLRRNLSELSRRPLIIRMDGANIPPEKREMLPRSDGLATSAAAEGWLLQKLRDEVLKIGIADCGLCLIAHNFIPSSSAAWALAEPAGRIVRIESLWGVPEGLY